MQKLELLNTLAEKVSNCTKCPNLVASRTRTVFGEGDPNANILFLGEGPGENEDETGRPFVGRAGKLLDNMLVACGWNREDVYICNIVKCRPHNNRVPTQQEAADCEPFLKLQIKIINPKFIVCLGTTATKYLLKTSLSIGRARGRWFKYTDEHVDADVLCTYHPSYGVRIGDESKQAIWNDLQLLVEKIKAC